MSQSPATILFLLGLRLFIGVRIMFFNSSSPDASVANYGSYWSPSLSRSFHALSEPLELFMMRTVAKFPRRAVESLFPSFHFLLSFSRSFSDS